MGAAVVIAAEQAQEDGITAHTADFSEAADEKQKIREQNLKKFDDMHVGAKDVKPKGKAVTDKRRASCIDRVQHTPQASAKEVVSLRYGHEDALTIGDIVSVLLGNGKEMEGLVLERINDFKIKVDFGETTTECLVDRCRLVTKAIEFETGDRVEVNPVGTGLYFMGRVLTVHGNKTMDVQMDGDDLDDIERGIPFENARKIMSRRALVLSRWRKAFNAVVAVNTFRGTLSHTFAEYG